jgi:hypothetical protein
VCNVAAIRQAATSARSFSASGDQITAPPLTAWQHVRDLCRMLRNPVVAQAHTALPAAAVVVASNDGRQSVLEDKGDSSPEASNLLSAWQSSNGVPGPTAAVHLTRRFHKAQEMIAGDAKPSHKQPNLQPDATLRVNDLVMS